MRVLFLIPHPREGASSRYRVLQYLPYLEARGIHCTVSSFLSPRFYRIAYQPGHWGAKIGCFLASSLRRLWDLVRSNWYDLVFIHLEAFPLGPPFIEWMLSLRGVPILFDLDDAIFLPRSSMTNLLIGWLRRPEKTASILRWSRSVITCNDYLRQYAEQFNPRVHVIPTCVDVSQFFIKPNGTPRSRPLIGWVGSHSTAPYLDLLRPVLGSLKKRHDFAFKIVGSSIPFRVDGVEVIQEPWTLDKDISYFQELDIGVYPLPEEPWVLGKTGFKTVQYMAVGVPCVASDIGRNREIIRDGINGFLAKSEDEWVEKLGRLISDPGLRARLGQSGRATVEENYSVGVHVQRLVSVLREAADSGQDKV